MDTPTWVSDAIFYQIFPDRFARSKRLSKEGFNFESWETSPTTHGFKGGDLYGVIEHLDYLQDLGITAIYFNPIFSSASNHRYHTYDYYNVDPLLGGNAALRELLDQAHERKIHIILDGVFNHASRGFWQFHHTLENGIASPYKDWFYFDQDHLYGKKHWGAYPSPHDLLLIQQEGSLKAIGYQAWWNLPALPKFNINQPDVRNFIFKVAEYWIKFGIDGWRLDVPGEIDDDSFWQEFRKRVRAINPNAYLVGEIWNDANRWLQGDQFDASMNFLVTGACLSFFTGKHLDLDTTLQAGGYKGIVNQVDAKGFSDRIDSILKMYESDVTHVQFNLLDCHDTPRFLTCAGNDIASLQLALTFIFTYPGTPCIFYGDEIGLSGGHDPECRQPFPWDEDKWNHNLRGLVKKLIKLRNTFKTLRIGSYKSLFAADGVYVFERRSADDAFVVALNSAEDTRTFEINDVKSSSRLSTILLGQAEFKTTNNNIQLTILPRSGVVIQV